MNATWTWPIIAGRRMRMNEDETRNLEKAKVPVQWLVGASVAIAGILGGSGLSVTIWATNLSGNVKSLLASQKEALTAIQAQSREMNRYDGSLKDLNTKLGIWEQFGGPWSKDISAIERRVAELERRNSAPLIKP